MNTKQLRNVAATALLAVGLFAGSVAPAAAAPNAEISIGGQLYPFQCYKDGNYYPLGTKLAAGPLFYWQCEMGWVTDSLGIPRYVPVWKVYPQP